MNQIDAQAADWAARTDGAALSAEDQARLQTWLAQDARHAGAFARAQALSVAYEHLHRPARSAGGVSDARIDRRRLLWGGGLAAAGVAGAALGVGVFAAPQTAYATGVGETARLDVGDRGEVVLDAVGRATVRRPIARAPRIDLLEGDLSVEAAGRLMLRCEGVLLSTTDAVLALSQRGDFAVLSVETGRVSTQSGGRELIIGPAQSVRLENGRVDKPVRIEAADWTRATAWRSGLVALEGETLAEATAMFARYSDTPIHIADAAASRRRVAGLFDARDPVGFAEAAAATTGLTLTRTAQGVTLSTPLE